MAVILGIDPGSNITGYGIIRCQANQFSLITSGIIRIKRSTIGDRLQQIFRHLQALVEEFTPDEVSIEEVFVHHNPRGAIQLGQARGVAIVSAAIYEVPIFEYSPRQIKQAVVGYGAAEKEQVQHMVQRLLAIRETLKPDAADALAVAICHALSRKTRKLLADAQAKQKIKEKGTVS